VGVIVGFDYGKARIGIAVSSESKTLAFAHGVYKRVGGKEDGKACAAFLKENNAEAFVIGLPLNMDGSEGDSAKGARILAKEIAKHSGCGVHFIDERLTTVEAYEKLKKTGKKQVDSRVCIDACAAEIILQEYLDANYKISDAEESEEE
jgi:putative Holliday junction resolvase